MGGVGETFGWAWIIAFFLVSLASWPMNVVVRWLFNRQMRRCARELSDAENSESEVFTKITSHFAMESAPLIGTIERVLYIFGIMFAGAYAIISGWLVLKAFSAWLQGQELQNKIKQSMAYYHLYLYGNALSLIAGLALGFAGLQLAGWPKWVAAIQQIGVCLDAHI